MIDGNKNGYEALEIHGLCQDDRIRQFHEGRRDTELFPIRYQPYDTRSGKRVESDFAGAKPQRRKTEQ